MQQKDFNRDDYLKPFPEDAHPTKERKPHFVIKKHNTKSLHHDLLLEMDGTFKSWVIPDGISMNPGKNRLAVAAEDYPLEHAEFEGIIPKHLYGSGTVMVWDTGTYDNLMIKEDDPVPLHKCYENGQFKIYLYGKRISGGFILVEREEKHMEGNWLLIKMDDEKAGTRLDPVTAEDKSILTGRTMRQIEQEARKGN